MPTLQSWGANSYGQLGVAEGPSEQEERPRLVHEPPTGIPRAVGGGGGHTLLLDDAGGVWACGWNHRGQLGGAGSPETTTVSTLTPSPAPPGHVVVGVAAGWDFSFLITDRGRVLAAGSNAYGQLGLEGVDRASGWTEVPGLDDVSAVSCGLRHALFLTRSGAVYGCGSSKKGQLGAVDKRPVRRPVRLAVDDVDPTKRVTQVAAGQFFSLALTADGHLYGCGDNKHGQLLASSPSVVTPLTKLNLTALPAASPVSQVSTGWTHVAVLLSNGDVYTWGRNAYGQLGREGDQPVGRVEFGERVIDLCCGSEHCLALAEKGRLFSWGWNEHGSCGDGATEDNRYPKLVTFDVNKPVLKAFAFSAHNFVCMQ